jgi:hypothetical protein
MESEYSDEDSSVEAPPPPPRDEDGMHEEQLKVFQGLAEFDNSAEKVNTGDEETGEDNQAEALLEVLQEANISDVEDDHSVEVPPPPGLIERNTPKGNNNRPIVFGACALFLLAVIVIALGVGFGTGAFTESEKETSGETPEAAAPSPSTPVAPTMVDPAENPEDSVIPPSGSAGARTDRVRSYLVSVAVNGENTFVDPLSPEARALKWLQEDDPLQLDPIEFANHYRLDQRFALLSIWFQSEFTWFDETNWFSDDECTWKGVTCETVSPDLRRKLQDGSQVVTGLDLASNNVQGNLPDDIQLLQYLETLNLSMNDLSGPIPSSIGNLDFMQELRLDANRFSGTLRDIDFSSFTNMELVDLSGNELSGSIPTSVYSMQKLVTLALDDNRFTGTLSLSIVNLSALGKPGRV